MKKLILLPLALILYIGTTTAQDAVNLIGKWSGAFPGQEGQLVPFTLTIAADSYQLDFGQDGTADITGAYTNDAAKNQITIWDTAGEGACPADKKGVYRYSMDGNTLTFTMITDDCPGRGGEPMVVQRM